MEKFLCYLKEYKLTVLYMHTCCLVWAIVWAIVSLWYWLNSVIYLNAVCFHTALLDLGLIVRTYLH